MKKKSIEENLRDLLKARQIPVLVLDTRWHDMFLKTGKPANVKQLEQELEGLLKEQGRLVNEIKDLKRAKKKLMDDVVKNMNDHSKIARNSQKLILEMNERILNEQNILMDMPYQIKDANERLLIEGMKTAYELMHENSQQLVELVQWIEQTREELKQKITEKIDKEETNTAIYTYMHDLLGPKAIEFFDQQNKKK